MENHDNLKSSRRKFLSTGIKLGMLPLFASPFFDINDRHKKISSSKSVAPLNILILGGTSFLGPHQIAYARNRGHSISIFTRGRTKPTINTEHFPHVEHLVGDRQDNLEALKGRKWDAVIDNSGRQAKWTHDTAQLLKDNANLYLYTSSTGVYYPYLTSEYREDFKPNMIVPDDISDVQKMEYGYGVMKAQSEIETIKAFGEDRSIIVRPTYMMGPGDRTDRFTYWPVRLKLGGEVMIPGRSEDPVQYIDARDVASWMIRLIEDKTSGSFNAVGPISASGMHAFTYGAHASFSSAVSFVPIPDYDFLKKQGVLDVIPWIMPVDDNYGSAKVNNQKAIKNGLEFTPLATSCKDIIDWWYSEAVTEERRIIMGSGERGLMAREKSIIAAWKSKK